MTSSTATRSDGATAPDTSPAGMSHRQILEAMTGLMLSMFVAMLSVTVVSATRCRGSCTTCTAASRPTPGSSPRPCSTTTASTPLWGKLADLTSKKLLMQLADPDLRRRLGRRRPVAGIGMLIACRAVQGIGAGGILAMTQVIMAAMVSPRERGRYSGYLGATFAVATIAGPLIGGAIVDTSWLGWRWCFYVGVRSPWPRSIVLQSTLHLPRPADAADRLPRRGARSPAASASCWCGSPWPGSSSRWVSFTSVLAGRRSAPPSWRSPWSELRAAEPIIPLQLFRHRTVALATSPACSSVSRCTAPRSS